MAVKPTYIRERIVIYKIQPKQSTKEEEIRDAAEEGYEITFLPYAYRSDVIQLREGESYPTDCHQTGFLGGIQNFFSDQECYYNNGSDPSFVGVLPYGRVVNKVFEDSSGWYVESPVEDVVKKKYIRGTLKDSNYEDYSAESITFYINPKHISIEKKKMKRKIRTYGGWEFQHWGPDIGSISMKGTTRKMMPSKTIREESDDWNIYDSDSYLAFRDLEEFYNEDHRVESETKIDEGILLGLSYRDRIYVGHFDSFTFEEDSEKPWVFNFDIRFSVEFEASSLTEAINTTSSRKIYDETFVRTLQGHIE